MKLTYPVNEPIITQLFGANSQFYSDPKYGGIKGHNGVDFLTYHGQPVYATHDGTAEYQIDVGGGHGVVVVSDDKKFKTIYWHLCDPKKEPQYTSPISKGIKKVTNGVLIGYADNTGASTGDHLHFGLKFLDNYEVLNKDNGYLGAVDPQPYFDGSTPVKIQLMEKQISLLKQVVEYLKLLIRG